MRRKPKYLDRERRRARAAARDRVEIKALCMKYLKDDIIAAIRASRGGLLPLNENS